MGDAPGGAPHRWSVRSACLLAGLAAAAAHPPYGFTPGLLGYAIFLWALGDIARRAPLPPFGGAPPRGGREDTGASPPRLGEGEHRRWWRGPPPAGSRLIAPPSPGDRRLRSAFFRGWLVGVGYFALSLHWLIFPFLVDAKDQGWMAPIAVVATVAFMALFWGTAGLAYRLIADEGGARPLLFAAALSAAEWTRGHLLTGFPWDLPGESWAAGSAMSQGAALFGVYGLTWATLAMAAAFAPDRARRWPSPARTAVALAALAGLWLFGEARLTRPPASPARPLNVRIVQPDISEARLEDPSQFAAVVRRYVELTRAPAPPGRLADVVIWPEGAIEAPLEDYLAPGTWTRAAVLGALTPAQTLLVGGYRWTGEDATRAYNSLAVVHPTPDAAASPILALYDKYRLVPFGEFIPLDDLAARLGIKQMVHVGGGFAAGPSPRPLSVPGLPAFQPLICYEALFPGFTRDGARRAGVRPAFIVNISTDAWFGPAAGPLQHFNLARYRSIEEGLPMLRATPTGVSAIVDALGRAPAATSLGLGRAGVIDAAVPAALPPTLYERLGDWPFAAMLVLSLLFAGGGRLGRRPRRSP